LYIGSLVIGLVFRFLPIVGPILSIILDVFVYLSMYQLLLAGARGKGMTVNETFEKTGKLFFQGLLLIILISLSALSFLLLIVPGILIMPRLALAPFYLVDKEMTAVEAYKASWHATKGHVGKVWGIVGVLVLMIIPSITIIGILLTIYWGILYAAAIPLLYLFLSKKKKKA
jgi:hypothetical protein